MYEQFVSFGVRVYGFVFFFKQKTAYEMRISDWSSDVCSSDLLSDVLEVEETAAFADDVEEVAVLAGRGVRPFAGRALAGCGAVYPDEHRPAGAVLDAADQPVATFALAAGQRFAAHGLGGAAETVLQAGGRMHHITGHPPRRAWRRKTP